MDRRLRAAVLINAAIAFAVPWRSGHGQEQRLERSLSPRAGFRVELMAAEPLIESPVAFDWGTDQRLWVVEMRDYPLGMDNHGKAGGRIVSLQDTDGDGRFDRSTLFLDGLLFPTGVMSWGKGILVTCAPEIFYAEDIDGDGRADRREVLFTGFGEANPQHRVNGLRWGLDNWVYCANGDFDPARQFADDGPADRSMSGFSPSQAEDLRRLAAAGAKVRSVRAGASYNLRNRDLRFRPDEGILDPQSGQSQFGRDRDDWGNWFGCNHATHAWHYALDDHYLRRNPHVASPSARVVLPQFANFAIGTGRETGTPRDVQGNAWTSACSVMVYRDTLFGPDFTDNVFTCEPVHNLIHRERLKPTGTTFTSERAADEPASEFLASADPMFTPVSIRTGPDGALWVIDMHRMVLEHPHWLPPGWETTIDVRAGHNQGRIYRIYPNDAKPRAWPRLDDLDAAGLVALLDSPNGWLRDKAQQLLVQQRNRTAIPLLRARAAAKATPLGRLHALCALDGLRALTPDSLAAALTDPHPGVRRHAIRLCEAALPSPPLEAELARCASDREPTVRLQLAYSLGSATGVLGAQALGALLQNDANNPFITAAALSSLTHANLAAVVQSLAKANRPIAAPVVQGLLQSAVGLGEPRAAAMLLNHEFEARGAGSRGGQFAALAGWLDALDQRGTPLSQLVNQAAASLRTELVRLGAIFDLARAAADAPETAPGDRVEAVRLLGRGLDHQREDREALARLLVPQAGAELQSAAVETLGRLRDREVPETLLKAWPSYTPRLKSLVLDVLLRRTDGTQAVLAALADAWINPHDVPVATRQRLLTDKSEDLRRRAAGLFADPIDPNRSKVIASYQAVLTAAGDADRGQQVFQRVCAACHRLNGVGYTVGPDLAMVRDKPADWFLPAIFDPSRAIDARYLNYTVATRDGKVLTGVLTEESGSSITLASPNRDPQVILRANVDEIANSGKSAMPEGLEKELDVQAAADVIAYLRRVPAAR